MAAAPFTAHFLVLRADGRLLVAADGPGPALPRREGAEHVLWNDAASAAGAAAEVLGAEAPLLRCLWFERPTEDEWHGYYELDPPAGGWVPPQPLSWAEPVPDTTARMEERERAVVERRLREGRPEAAVAAWAQPGWLSGTTTWLDERLGGVGRKRVGAVEQLRVWSISTVLRAPSDRGDVFLKSVPPLFAAEPLLTRELARRHPRRVPEVLAVDEERRLLLMQELPPGRALSELEPPEWEDAVREYARIQIAWIDRGLQLTALGCPDRRLEALERELAPALRDLPSMLPGEPHGLTNEELDALPGLEAALREACAELREAGIPPTLEHGDLHGQNVRVGLDGAIFFDWTDGCLSVPFFSLVPLLEDMPAAAAALLRDAYLEEWAPHLPPGDHVAAFELCQYLGLFHLLVSYREILAGIDPREHWQWRRVVPHLARRLLRHAASG